MRAGLIAGVLALAGTGAVAYAQVDAAATVKARQERMKAIGAHFKAMMDQVRGGSPDVALVKRHAADLAVLSPKVTGWFPAGTGPETGLKMGAKAEIWAKAAEFRKAAADFEAQSNRLLATANAGDVAALGPQVRALGGTCKGCHDGFRRADD